MTPRDESGFRHLLRVRLGVNGPGVPYTRESVAQAKARQELEREQAVITMHLPTSLQHMVKGD